MSNIVAFKILRSETSILVLFLQNFKTKIDGSDSSSLLRLIYIRKFIPCRIRGEATAELYFIPDGHQGRFKNSKAKISNLIEIESS